MISNPWTEKVVMNARIFLAGDPSGEGSLPAGLQRVRIQVYLFERVRGSLEGVSSSLRPKASAFICSV